VSSRAGSLPQWDGDSLFLLRQLVVKDFRIRYRNMSLGLFWSILNPLVMLGLLTYVFTQVFVNNDPLFPLIILTGMIPYNFFSMSWISATTSLLDNASLYKRVPIRRELIPVASVLSNLLHLFIQLGLLIGLGMYYGIYPNLHWAWLPLIWGLELFFIIGLGLASSALNVLVRDTRYVVESSNLVLFWLVPIFYTFAMVPEQYRELYQFNPVAALVLASRRVILENAAPPGTLLWKLTIVSTITFVAGLLVFRRLQTRFYAHI
jgi:ABC-type polysaccharide/polyol phosphate export permease